MPPYMEASRLFAHLATTARSGSWAAPAWAALHFHRWVSWAEDEDVTTKRPSCLLYVATRPKIPSSNSCCVSVACGQRISVLSSFHFAVFLCLVVFIPFSASVTEWDDLLRIGHEQRMALKEGRVKCWGFLCIEPQADNYPFLPHPAWPF